MNPTTLLSQSVPASQAQIPLMKRNPHFGPNIKRLKGEYSDLYRYRISDYRLFYSVQESEIKIYVIDIAHSNDAYK